MTLRMLATVRNNAHAQSSVSRRCSCVRVVADRPTLRTKGPGQDPSLNFVSSSTHKLN